MVDKVWYDWQRAHPDNFWSYEGGAVRDLDTWPRYKTGAPPALSVRFLIFCFSLHAVTMHPFSSIPDFRRPAF